MSPHQLDIGIPLALVGTFFLGTDPRPSVHSPEEDLCTGAADVEPLIYCMMVIFDYDHCSWFSTAANQYKSAEDVPHATLGFRLFRSADCAQSACPWHIRGLLVLSWRHELGRALRRRARGILNSVGWLSLLVFLPNRGARRRTMHQSINGLPIPSGAGCTQSDQHLCGDNNTYGREKALACPPSLKHANQSEKPRPRTRRGFSHHPPSSV